MEKLMMEVLNVVATIVAGLMVGCELAIAAFIHPTLDKLPDEVHLPPELPGERSKETTTRSRSSMLCESSMS